MAILTIPYTTLSLTSELSSFRSSISIGNTSLIVRSFPNICAIAQRAGAVPALNYAYASAYEAFRVGKSKLAILSVEI